MTYKTLRNITACVVLAAGGSMAHAGEHTAKVDKLSSTWASNDCVAFTLEGVPEADPSKPNNPWFALSRSTYGARDGYAMLLTAKLTGKAVYVSTSGLVCNFPAVYQILLQ